ncbi:maleylpyruvate isomerase N-terminal domain-containing protein [Streptomyces sp. H27-D2]|uniref:maleylpyruvate isomerase N-terminal domain-containing protein n=1 Tax=Streptomyces sp. H27-D2 TaxID=3046304 RepID=UPI002DBC8D8D|nr:maleylpyruvate isomerase N-terminal domain-containing protein [Streptomyces sp. H27-D2]MEC4018615.1 maleylpyruvate isomerase N-terminal domain-containing protein [Streptomyces sp. H27-D2]
MSTAHSTVIGPVTAADVERTVQLAVAALREGLAADWSAPAGGLEWDCWETVEHLADDLFAYAAQLGPKSPPLEGEVPFLWAGQRPGGPKNAIFADRAAGPAGLLQVLEASGALLVAMVGTTSPEVRAHHSYGVSDPEGFAAMGIVETLVHTYDIAEGLGVAWAPPADVCERVLARLFPDAPSDGDRWRTLLWATGRTELPGRARLATWRWNGVPRADDAV